MKKLLMMISASVAAVCAFAADATGTVQFGGVTWTYSELNETAKTLTLGRYVDWNNSTRAMPTDASWDASEIPSSFVIDGETYTVTKIADRAFDGCNGLTGVLRIPQSVANMGPYTFRSTSLTGIASFGQIPGIGNQTFGGCSQLRGPLPSFEKFTQTADSGNYATVQSFENCTSLSGVCINGQVNIRAYKTFNGCTALKVVLFGTETAKTSSSGSGGNAMLNGVTGCKVVMPRAGWNGVSVGGTSNDSIYYGPNEDFDLSIDEGHRVVTAVPANVDGLVEILECAPLFKTHLGLNTRVNITNTLEVSSGTITAEMLNAVEFNSLQLTFKVNTQEQLQSVLDACPASSYPLLAIDPSDAKVPLTLPQNREIFVRLSGDGKQGQYTPKINGLIISFH